MTRVTLIADSGAEVELSGHVEGERISVDLSEGARALGWSTEAAGLCRGDVCVPVPPALGRDDLVDVRRLGNLLQAPVAVDGVGAAAVGAPASLHAQHLATDVAPDFTLESLAGGDFTLASLRGRKCLLVAWASW